MAILLKPIIGLTIKTTSRARRRELGNKEAEGRGGLPLARGNDITHIRECKWDLTQI